MPECAAKWFLERFKNTLKNGVADLSGELFLLPTRAAARSFKNAVILKVKAISNFNVSTFEDELSKYEAKNALNRTTARAIWVSVLRGLLANNKLPENIFSGAQKPEEGDLLSIADELILLQTLLAEGMLDISSAYEQLAKDATFADFARWGDLNYLNTIFTKQLGDFLGHVDARQNAINAIIEKGTVKRVYMVGNPEISKTMQCFLRRLKESGGEFCSVVFSNSSEKYFDEFGLPTAEYAEKDLEIPESSLKVFVDCKSQAKAAANLAGNYGENVYKTLAVACDQVQNLQLFAAEFKKNNISANSLDGKPLKNSVLFGLIKSMSDLAMQESFANTANFIGNFYAAKKCAQICGKSIGQIFEAIDALYAEFCCATLSQAYSALNAIERNESSKLKAYLFLKKIFAFAQQAPRAKDISGFVNENFTEFVPQNDILEREALNLLQSASAEIDAAENFAKIKFSNAEKFAILSDIFGKKALPPKIDANSVLLQDWIEAYWSPKAHLLLCDMNDQIVPLADLNGMFLTDFLRNKLELRTQKLRQARDAFMLESTMQMRSATYSKADICVPKNNLVGDVLLPSRILFQTQNANLPSRVNRLFCEPKIDETPFAHSEWTYYSAKDCEIKKDAFSASALNDYINSPWQYYLKNVLKMSQIDPFKSELDALQFGTIMHEILRTLPEIAGEQNEIKIKNFLAQKFEQYKQKNFPDNLRGQIRMQLGYIKNRLMSLAKLQSRLCENNWVQKYAELGFCVDLGSFKLNGVIDRVDYNTQTNEVLIIDYKTFEKAEKGICKKKHYAEKLQKWQNLQLPLYCLAAESIEQIKSLKPQSIKCAYIVLPKDTTSTCIDGWDDIQNYIDSALKKANEVVMNIKTHNFAPPEKNAKNDAFESLFGFNSDEFARKYVENYAEKRI